MSSSAIPLIVAALALIAAGLTGWFSLRGGRSQERLNYQQFYQNELKQRDDKIDALDGRILVLEQIVDSHGAERAAWEEERRRIRLDDNALLTVAHEATRLAQEEIASLRLENAHLQRENHELKVK